MGKNISLIIAILLVAVFLAFQLNNPWRHISPSEIFTVVVSIDDHITPGRPQDFLVNIFKDINGQRTFEDKSNFAIKILMPLTTGSTKEVKRPLICHFPGKYSCTYDFPSNLDDSKKVNISILLDKTDTKPILKSDIPIKRENAIIVQPPIHQIHTGDRLAFRLGVMDKKSGLGCYKIPVRVKMHTPSGITTINRVVTTDTEGLGVFQTKIHPAAPEGFYTFIFQSGNSQQKIVTYIKKAEEKKQNNLNLDSTATYVQEQENNETCGYIFNLNCERDNALLAYGCPDSHHRQIEIWQNGKLHYFANLDLEGGTVSLILQKPLLAGCPALFKVWQMKDNSVSSHEKIRYIHSNNPAPLNSFLAEVNAEFQNTENDRLASALARKGFIGASSKIKIENLTKVYSQDLKAAYPQPQSEIPIDYYEGLLYETNETSKNRIFYLVENEIEINGSESCKIWLDPKSFLEGYISENSLTPPSLKNLLQQALCRVDKFEYLDLPGKKEEIEAIEGLLIPLSEVYVYLNKFHEKKKIYGSSILSTVSFIKRVTFVPAEFTFDFSKDRYDLNSMPMLDIKPTARSFQSIQGLLKQRGKIQLNNTSTSRIIELDKNIVEIHNENAILQNLRSQPLVISK